MSSIASFLPAVRSSSPRRAARILTCALLFVPLVAFAQASTSTFTRTQTALPGPRYAYVAMPDAPDSDAGDMRSPEFRKRMQLAIDKALQAKGYVPASGPNEADFIVATRLGVHEVDQISMKETPMNAQGGATPQASIQCTANGCSQLVTASPVGQPILKTSIKHVTEGELLIEIIQPKTILVLWRASKRGTVKRGDGKQSRLDVIASQTLADLPALPR